MTTVYLAAGGRQFAYSATPEARQTVSASMVPAAWVREAAILCSFVYLKPFVPVVAAAREWSLDSGAFTARQSGQPITVSVYIDALKALRDSAVPFPGEVFSLDEIGDWRASERNLRAIEAAGFRVIPVHHLGEPMDVLRALSGEYPKVALGGMARSSMAALTPYVEAAFAVAWPRGCVFHGFGLHKEEVLMRFPFHSADATSWQLGPLRYGNWKAYGKAARGPRVGHDLTPEARLILDLERRLKARWGAALAGAQEVWRVRNTT